LRTQEASPPEAGVSGDQPAGASYSPKADVVIAAIADVHPLLILGLLGRLNRLEQLGQSGQRALAAGTLDLPPADIGAI
jgi:hypothetical protein